MSVQIIKTTELQLAREKNMAEIGLKDSVVASTHWKTSSITFSSRYRKLHLNDEMPRFFAGFLGRCEVDRSENVENAAYRSGVVFQILSKTRRLKKQPRKVEIVISSQGIEILDMQTGAEELIPIHLVNRGMTDFEKPRIFAFLSTNSSSKRLECFAFVVNKAKVSFAMTLALKRSFEVAYEAWKMQEKKRSKHQNERLIKLAEDLCRNRIISPGENEPSSLENSKDATNEEGFLYRSQWTKFEEDLMDKPGKRFSFKKSRPSQGRRPSVKEIICQPSVDMLFKERQKKVSCASVLDIGDNEILRNVAEDEDVQVISLQGMSKREGEKAFYDIDDTIYDISGK